MSHEIEEPTQESHSRSGWGLLGAFALLGLATATIIVLNRKRATGKMWNVDDIMDAADRAADNLERTLLGEQARAS